MMCKLWDLHQQLSLNSLCADDGVPLTVRLPFSETSNLLVAGMRRTSNWTAPVTNSQQLHPL